MSNNSGGNSNSSSIWETLACSSGTVTDRHNQARFVRWSLALAITYVVSTWILKSGNELNVSLQWLVAFVPGAIGVMTVFSFMKFLRMADELIQKIQMEGLAVGFGVGVIFTLAYQTLEYVGAPKVELNDVLLVLIVGWMLGQIIAAWRYK